jgi:Flp pilus assembly protein TadB
MCHRHYHHRYRDTETSAEPPAARGPVRVGDAERERVVELLRQHAAAGRLEPDELEQRIESAYGARYGSDLQAVLEELPAERQPRRPRGHARPAAPLFALAVAALVAAAAVSGAWWLLWLIWPVAVVLGPRRYRSPWAARRTIDASMSHSTGARSSV